MYTVTFPLFIIKQGSVSFSDQPATKQLTLKRMKEMKTGHNYNKKQSDNK